MCHYQLKVVTPIEVHMRKGIILSKFVGWIGL